MVQIPEFKAKTGLTSQTGTRARPVPDITAAAAAPFEAAAELAGDVQKVSTRFYEAQKSLQRKTEATKLLDQYLKGDQNISGLNQLSFDAQNNPNTNTALQDFQTGNENLIKNISNGIKDPVVKQIFTSKANEVYNNEYLGVQSAVWKNVREDGIKTLNKNIEFETNQILNAGGNKSKEFAARINIEKLIEDANRDGLGLPDDYFQTTLNSVDLLKADKLVTDNPDVFLKNWEQGYYNDKIDPENLLTLRDRALGKVEAAKKSAIGDIKTLVTTSKNKLKDLTDPLKDGEMINTSMVYEAIQEAEQISAASEAIGGESLRKEIFELEAFYKNAGLIDSYKNYNRSDLINAIKIEEENKEKLDDPIRIDIQDNLLKNMNTILNTMDEELDDNMLGYYQKVREGIAVPELDLGNNLELEDFYGRYQIAHKARNELDPRMDVQYFTKNEKLMIKSILESNDREKIEILLGNISLVAQEDAGKVLKRLGYDNPGMAHMGNLLLGGKSETTISILDGHIASKDPISVDQFKNFKKDKIEDEELTNIASSILTADFRNQHPQASNNIIAAADLIFFDMVTKNKNEIKNKSSKAAKEMYTQAIQMAAGLTYKQDGKPYGGFTEYQDGNYILLPGNMINGDFDDDSPSLKEILEDRMDLDLLSKAIGGAMPVDPDGNEIPIESFINEDGGIKDAFYLETIGRGQYYITAGNPSTFEVAYYKDERGKPIVFNLEIIAADLLKDREVKVTNEKEGVTIGGVRGTTVQ